MVFALAGAPSVSAPRLDVNFWISLSHVVSTSSEMKIRYIPRVNLTDQSEADGVTPTIGVWVRAHHNVELCTKVSNIARRTSVGEKRTVPSSIFFVINRFFTPSKAARGTKTRGYACCILSMISAVRRPIGISLFSPLASRRVITVEYR